MDDKGDFMDNKLNTKAFGKNDIRGIFPSEVNSEIFFCAAKGYVQFALDELKRLNQEKAQCLQHLVLAH